ncbi:short-chain fatty acid transporter [Myceligenerans sp. I2]|uniref:Short-chain fatty acid transporter n=2 Tax=Myceligenerans indicum TaxID=2593663 RepID=A0ABS1LFG5_9MICO|nr:short-chain fatty acid transporter [Myceligenerans indicum]
MRPLNALVERFLPSAFVFAVLLTVVVAVLGLALTDAGPEEVLVGWGEGLSGLLAFMTQMALILLLGHVLANTRPVRWGLVRVAGLPRSAVQAYVFVAVAASVLSLVQWGLGLVAGGLLAREVAAQMRARGVRVHFPLLVAAAFSGFVVWHMGYTGSGPLTAATEGSVVAGQLGDVIPVGETTFSPWNVTAAVVTVLAVAGALALVAPRRGDDVTELAVDARTGPPVVEQPRTPADRLDASRGVTLLAGLGLAAYLAVYFAGGGTSTLDVVNWTFLALVLLLVRSPFELAALVRDAASNVGEILLQFPLYAGILGMMTATGLIQVFSDAFVAISTPQTFGIWAFVSAGLVNFFVPSGGGQFAVQAPILLDAAGQLGVDPAVAVMAVSYGDQWTNMIQPFWALPLLAIAGLKIRDILGYTTVTLLVSGVVFVATLAIVGAG